MFVIVKSGEITGTIEPGRSLVIDSIEQQNIPEYEVVIVGNSLVSRKNTKVIPFDESVKNAWITKKRI